MPYRNFEENSPPLSRFESMLKTNTVLFFDSGEFEDITAHYLEIGKISLAKKAVRLGLEQHPTSLDLKLYQVDIYMTEDKLGLAENLLDELQAIEGANEDIYIQKAGIYSRRGDHLEAIQLLEQTLEFAEDQAEIYDLIGLEYFFMEDYENAKSYLVKCLEAAPEDYASLHNVVSCFEFLDQADEAITFLDKFLDKNPYCEVGWQYLGQQYYHRKLYDKALAAFDFAIISDDTFIGAYLEKGKTLEKLGRYEEALEVYSLTLELDDPTSFALLHIGMCHERLGNQRKALAHYLRCVEEDALLDKAWLAITDFYKRRKNYKKALYFIDKAIRIDTENPLYWLKYARISRHLKFYEEAEYGYRKALELGHDEPDTWTERAELLTYLGEADAAIENLLQALKHHPDNTEVHYRLAGLYYHTNQVDKAEFFLETGLRLNPEDRFVLELLYPDIYDNKHVQRVISGFKRVKGIRRN